MLSEVEASKNRAKQILPVVRMTNSRIKLSLAQPPTAPRKAQFAVRNEQFYGEYNNKRVFFGRLFALVPSDRQYHSTLLLPLLRLSILRASANICEVARKLKLNEV